MSAYTITEVADSVRSWDTKAGVPWKSYRVTLRNEHGAEKGNVELSRAATDPVPKPGEVVEGTVENREQYGPKLNTPRKGGGGWKPKPPEERRSIAMQASHKVAVDIAALALQHGLKAVEVERVVEACAARLFAQVQKAEGGQ